MSLLSLATMLLSAALRITSRSAEVVRIATRTMVGKTIPRAPHDGWPRLAPDGWPYSRWLKSKGDYETKQAKARRKGRNRGKQSLEPLDLNLALSR